MATTRRRPAHTPRARAGVMAGIDMLRAGRPLDEACEHACALVDEHERAAVRVAIEAEALRLTA